MVTLKANNFLSFIAKNTSDIFIMSKMISFQETT